MLCGLNAKKCQADYYFARSSDIIYDMLIGGIRNSFVEHNTEDKGWWCHHGEKLEETFVEICKSKLGINVFINPEKATNRYAHDLIFVDKNGVERIADLKTQNTPFFTAARYDIDPRYAVTFNRKDYERYKSLYPEIVIFYWIDWKQLEWRGNKIEYLGGIYVLPFPTMMKKIESGQIPEHSYIFRRNDTAGNAKSSFVFDLHDFQCLVSIEPGQTNL